MGFEPSLWAWVLVNVVLFIAIVATAVSTVKKPTKFKGLTLLVLLVMFLILVSYKVLSFKMSGWFVRLSARFYRDAVIFAIIALIALAGFICFQIKRKKKD